MPCLHEHAFDEQLHRDASRDGIIAAERALYLRRAAGGKFPASVHTDTADQIRRKP
ncbi:hypothetical protein CLOM621_07860 [Clostridium sp. M62/1]|nr:hypothetical protein CLOM621_07860 [Clostridium sp. M62/1]CBK78096.1 hypothetical protein CLS_27540 [[Clostridium] cf. saccharolyticum K10]